MQYLYLDIDISHKMITKVVTDIHLFNLSILHSNTAMLQYAAGKPHIVTYHLITNTFTTSTLINTVVSRAALKVTTCR